MKLFFTDRVQRFIFLLFCLPVFSCKKETPTNITLEFLSPSPSGIYFFDDTILVQVQLSSIQEIKSVEVSLRNSADVSVCPTASFNPLAKNYLLSSSYALKEDNQPSGNYKLVVTASDGFKTYSKAQSIFVSNRPKNLRSVFFLSTNSIDLKISRMDTGQVLPFTTIPGDFTGAEISSSSHILFTACRQTGGLNWIETETGQIVHSMPLFSSGIPNFIATAYFENNFYVSRFDGFLRAYGSLGNQTFSTTENPYYINYLIVKSGQNIFTGTENLSSSERGIMVYSYPYGAERQYRLTDFIPEKILAVSSDSILIFGEKNGKTGAWYYFLSTNNYNQIKDFGSVGRVYDALELPSGKILLASNSGILEWNRSLNSSFMVRSEHVTDLEYESIGRRIFCAIGHQVFAMDENFFTVFTSSFIDSVVAVKVEYSR